VRIERPIDAVFDYVSDPQNFPRWNSAVRAVRKTSAGEGEAGSTYSMERDLPSGRAENDLEVVGHERPREFSIRTTSGSTPFLYRYTFSPEDGATIVRLDAEVELPVAVALVGPLARRAVKKGGGRELRHSEAHPRSARILNRWPSPLPGERTGRRGRPRRWR
jgi:uncharacterized protein YndB with AHSA1/START domain